MKISVVIPFYCEDKQVPLTVTALTEILNPYDHELILVDDGSTDTTWAVITELAKTNSAVKGIRLSRNYGKESALFAGISHASGDAVIVMDGDLQHPPSHIPHMIELWQNGAKIVEGVKSQRGKESLLSRLNASIFYRLFRRASGFNIDNASDFKLLDRQVVNAVLQFNERETFFRGLTAWVGFERATFIFDVEERHEGKSKWSFTHKLRLSLNAITGFSATPLALIAVLGAILVSLFFIIGAQTLINWSMGRAAGGFTTVILLELLLGGSILLSLSLIGLYIARIFDEVKARPRYLIAEKTPDEAEK